MEKANRILTIFAHQQMFFDEPDQVPSRVRRASDIPIGFNIPIRIR